MRSTLLPLFLLVFAVPIFAQHEQKGDTLILHRVNYPNGLPSAYAWLLQSTGNGRANCWSPKGEVMFTSEISRNHGHHSVYFEHHANRVVSKVEESSAPDAGIQWYRSYYYFDENGVKTGESKESHEDLMHLRVIEEVNPVSPVVEPKTAECAVIYTNQTWFVNRTEFILNVTYTYLNETKTLELRPGEEVLMGTMIQAQFFQDPSKTAVFTAQPKRKNRRSAKWEFQFQKVRETKTSDSSMEYVFEISQRLKK